MTEEAKNQEEQTPETSQVSAIEVDGKRVVFSPPNKDTPGYLRRQRCVLELENGLNEAATPSEVLRVIEKMIDFILPFITEPEDRKVASDLLFDLSENQWHALFDQIKGKEGEAKNSPETPTTESS